MTYRDILVACTAGAIVLGLSASAAGQPAPARLADREIEALVDRLDDQFDDFDDAVDDQFEHSVLRGPQGELDVDRWLDDFDDKIDRLDDRLDDDYSASSEAADLLQHASQLPRFLGPAGLGSGRGASEWNRLAADLDRLATAYGAAFPLAEGAVVRRLTDREVAAQARLLARDADRFEDVLDDDLDDIDVSDEIRDAATRDVKRLHEAAERLEDRLKDHRPASSEAERVFVDAARIRARVDRVRTPNAWAAWSSINARLEALAAAFGTVW